MNVALPYKYYKRFIRKKDTIFSDRIKSTLIKKILLTIDES